jgi:hypothetical protein
MVPEQYLFINLKRSNIKQHTSRSNCQDLLAEYNAISKSLAEELPFSFLPSRAEHDGTNTTYSNLAGTGTCTATLPPNAFKPD